MVLLRLHVSLEAATYERFYYGMIAALWMDVDKRLEMVKAKYKHSQKDLRIAQGSLIQSLIEYDEARLRSSCRIITSYLSMLRASSLMIVCWQLPCGGTCMAAQASIRSTSDG